MAAQESGRTVVWTTARQTVSGVGEVGRWGDAGWCSEASRGWDSQAQQQLLSMAITMGRTSEHPMPLCQRLSGWKRCRNQSRFLLTTTFLSEAFHWFK